MSGTHNDKCIRSTGTIVYIVGKAINILPVDHMNRAHVSGSLCLLLLKTRTFCKIPSVSSLINHMICQWFNLDGWASSTAPVKVNMQPLESRMKITVLIHYVMYCICKNCDALVDAVHPVNTSAVRKALNWLTYSTLSHHKQVLRNCVWILAHSFSF